VAVKAEARVLECKIMGVLIRAAREKAHRTVNQVAERLGVTVTRVRQYEMGTQEISLPELQMLALYLRVPLSFFISGQSTVKPETPTQPTPEEARALRGLIATKLKQARLAAGRTPEECAKLIGRSVAMYGRYERGLNDIPITELGALSEFLGLSVNSLVQEASGRKAAGDVMDLEAWSRLPTEVRAFVLDSSSLPYLRMAMKFRDLPVEKLQELGEILLVVRRP
jgi:transcriptional regulator with XRE-family HTH domain